MGQRGDACELVETGDELVDLRPGVVDGTVDGGRDLALGRLSSRVELRGCGPGKTVEPGELLLSAGFQIRGGRSHPCRRLLCQRPVALGLVGRCSQRRQRLVGRVVPPAREPVERGQSLLGNDRGVGDDAVEPGEAALDLLRGSS